MEISYIFRRSIFNKIYQYKLVFFVASLTFSCTLHFNFSSMNIIL